MFGTSGDATKDDVEKNGGIVFPEHRGIEAINVLDPAFETARNAGVTTVCVGPGSISAIAGTHVALKTSGYILYEMVVRDPVAMKAAIGENPKRFAATRMTIFSAIRNALINAKEYKRKLDAAQRGECAMPQRDPKSEALLPVIEKKIHLKVHGYRVDDLQSIMAIAKECDVKLTLEHATDAFMLTKQLKEQNIPVALGPYFSQNRRAESVNKAPIHAVELIREGILVSIMSDAPVISEEYLAIEAGLLVREGLSEFEAIKTITANPAKHLGIEDRVGTIKVGLDADFVVCKGCPLSVFVKPEAVFINGRCVYER